MLLTAAGAELRRALGVVFVGLGAAVTFESLTSRRWASITFAGERHKLVLRLPGPGAQAAVDAFLDGLADREFALRGHIVADIEATGIERDGDGQLRLTLEALTVEDD
ncbi:hypothetical protein [Allosphingosinicella sp.]|uniref:hypothetical protein n=1 Tax=Allosphingosinicella sp. TaxID=2823234 RepID=UPI0037850BD2